ncbi:MAG: bifunctional D-glycero-beta-D-manno-heptose-7-phosphate kinase/D-glycero-beta-D-manno-heptose 1-phosphate adenylyltransferase HldE [Chromatiales bacterium]|jgi:D-beta-D-heptose 7-phosphate kinase/D-beta-D-heptose 1-phosphate adenosyltransferase
MPLSGLGRLRDARVLVVGDIMLDRYWYGDSERISPEAPVPVVHVRSEEERLGGAGNVAANVAALGGQAAVVALVGEDTAAGRLEALLAERGCGAALMRVPAAPTISKLRVVSRHQQLIRLDFEQDFRGVRTPDLLKRFEERLDGCDAVVLSDYGKGTLGDPQALIGRARAAGKPVIVDPKRRDFAAYHGAALVTPNLGEFRAAGGAGESDEEIAASGGRLLHASGIDNLLVTRSERGMTLLPRDGEPLHLPARAREVFDVTGAGDTVVAAMAAGMAAGLTLAECASLANTAAGLVVGRLGTAAVGIEELERELGAAAGAAHGVVGEARLIELARQARARGERVVITNGCFDLLHPGHVGYLEKAAELGDRLVVAVNDDDSVRRLKGAGRPVNALNQRMAVLAGLRAVDWVVPFSEDTPERLICAVRPDVLVKGGDYRPAQIAGARCVQETGGQVVVLDYVEGCSTSAVIDAIRRG